MFTMLIHVFGISGVLFHGGGGGGVHAWMTIELRHYVRLANHRAQPFADVIWYIAEQEGFSTF